MDRWRRDDALAVYHYGDNRIRQLSYRIIEDAARYEDFPDFRQPALIFHGAHDDVVPVRSSEEFVSGHPNAVLQVMNSGHDLLTAIEEIAPEVVEFLTAE